MENLAMHKSLLCLSPEKTSLNTSLSELQHIAWKARLSLQTREAKIFSSNSSNKRDLMTAKFEHLRDSPPPLAQ